MADTDMDMDFAKMKVADLKLELKKRGLSTEGKKNELLERLQTSIGDAALLDDTHDDLLDEDVLSDDEVLNDSVPSTPPAKPAVKRPTDEDDASSQNRKRIILNRASVDVPTPAPEQKVEEGGTKTEESAPQTETKVIKLTAVSSEERLRLRAARFGSQSSTEALSTNNSNRPISSKITPPETNLELLKKRAERFGAVAPILEKAELEDRKQKRLARFGATATANAASITSGADKKAQRAQRFQLST